MSFWRPGAASAPPQPSSLPTPRQTILSRHRLHILHALEHHRTLLLTTSPSTDLSTALPDLLASANWTSPTHALAVALPSPAAALAAAASLARASPPDAVGYVLPLTSRRSRETCVIFATVPALVAALRDDALLSTYAVVIVDAADRALWTDVVIALLRAVQVRHRPDLRVIVTSAAGETGDVVDFFGGARAVASVDCRTDATPVRVVYCPRPVEDFLQKALEVVQGAHAKWARGARRGRGDVVVFVPGVREVDDFCQMVANWAREIGAPQGGGSRGRKREREWEGGWRQGEGGSVRAIPLHSGLVSQEQLAALETTPSHVLKIVVATDVAEASRVEGIATVVDCGLETVSVYSAARKSKKIASIPISKSSATQRANVVGRDQAGACYRLYMKSDYDSTFASDSPPEMLRSDLTDAVLRLKSVGVEQLARFEFLTPPPLDAIASAMGNLHSLGALKADGSLSNVGERLADLPLPPHLGRVLIAGEERGVGDLAAAACAMLQVSGSLFTKARSKMGQDFVAAEGDVVSLTNMYRRWLAGAKSPQWCATHGVSIAALGQAHNLCQVLRRCLRKTAKTAPCKRVDSSSATTRLTRALAIGMFSSLAQVSSDGRTYNVLLSGTSARIHPRSVLYGRAPAWIVASHITTTTQAYLHNVTVVDARALAADMPTIFTAP